MAVPEDRVDAAVDELYRADPAGFVARRTELSRAARTAGDPDAAKAITALKRPTRPAWLVNRLIRSDPAVIDTLDALSGRLHSAQASLSGERIREATAERRSVVGELVRRALEADVAASSAVRDEVTSTFEAALADPEVGAAVADGRLLRAAAWSGLGSVTPSLALVTDRGTPATRSAGKPARSSRPAAKTGPGNAGPKDDARRRRLERLERAERELQASNERVEAAGQAADDAVEQVRLATEQLADLRRRADEAALDLRRARAEHRRVEQSVARLTR